MAFTFNPFTSTFDAVGAGTTGACGVSGVSGVSGVTGIAGSNGACGISGVSGVSGVQGTAGGAASWLGPWETSTLYAVDDIVSNIGSSWLCYVGHTSGSTTEPGVGVNFTDKWLLVAQNGACGVSGVSGVSGTTGAGGACGVSGVSGISGVAGSNGSAGACGISGVSGVSGVAGAAGACGVSGVSGVASTVAGPAGACGVSGVSGVSGTTGSAGACGVSGVSGVSGVKGDTGACGISGVSGMTGEGINPLGAYDAGIDYILGDSVDYLGSSYLMFTDAPAGTVPTNTTYWQVLANKGNVGACGVSGVSGVSGTAGTNGACGVSGVSGVSGVAGTNGACGISGVAGSNGACGISGVSGTASTVAGPAGACGVSGVSGVSGVKGDTGNTGACGISGTAGSNGACGISGVSGVSGVIGNTGACGISGVSGVTGVSGVPGTQWRGAFASSTVYVLNDLVTSGGSNYICILGYTSTATTPPNDSTHWALFASVGACGVSGVSGVSGVAGTNGACGISGVSGATGVAGTNGACGVSGVSGISGVSGVAGACGVSGISGVSGVIGATGPNSFTARLINATSFDGSANIVNNFPQGFLINGKIVPSVASNNLTVAIKRMDGNDPSATNPVYVRTGDTIRSITTALSVTKNGGTNWFNSGATILATKEIDYFVYLGYNGTDGVTIGFARIPYGTQYVDFSITNTNERYCAISTITNAAASDTYEVIGRFAATLSATANFYWSVPAFTNTNLIQRPVYTTRNLVWVPTLAWTGGTAPTGSPTSVYFYKVIDNECFLHMSSYGYTAGLTVTALDITTPFDHISTMITQYIPTLLGVAGNGADTSVGVLGYNSANLNIQCVSISANSFWVSGSYLI